MIAALPAFTATLPSRSQTARLVSTFVQAERWLVDSVAFSDATSGAQGISLMRSGATTLEIIAPQLGGLAGKLRGSAQAAMSALRSPVYPILANLAIEDVRHAAQVVAALPTRD